MIIHSIQTVYEIDRTNSSSNRYMGHSRAFGYQELSDIFKQMAIVIPVKNEKLSVLEGVLSGIPNECLIIIVSNSERTSNVDRYSMEVEMVKQYARFTDKKIMVIHQKDEELGKIFKKVNYNSILDSYYLDYEYDHSHRYSKLLMPCLNQFHRFFE